MNGTVLNRIDYVAEAYALLLHLGTGKKYQQLKEELKKKYQFSNEVSERKFKILLEIEKQAEKKFAGQMDLVRYYFENSVENRSSVARLVILWDEYENVYYETLSDMKKNIDGMKKEDFCKRFGEVLQSYCEIIRDTSQHEIMTKPMQIIRYLMQMDITDAEKMKIQKAFLDREKHEREVLALMEQAIEVLKKNEEELLELTDWFRKYWTNIFEHQDFFSYFSEKMAVSFEENPEGFVVRPMLISVNQMGLFAETEDLKKPYYCMLGIMFDDDFTIARKTDSKGNGFEPYMLQVMKVLSDKSKFEILAYIKDKKAYGSELAKHLDLTTATISHHMNALVNTGLVKMEKEDAKVYYTTNKEALEEVLNYCKMRLVNERD